MILYRLATSTDEIAEMVNYIDSRTVLKVVALDGVHKTDLCGVLLNLKSPKEEEKGYAAVICNLQDSRLEMDVQGCLYSPCCQEHRKSYWEQSGIDYLVSW